VKATLVFANEQLNIQTVLAIVMPTNIPSIKLLEKVGMKFMKTFQYPEKAEELMLFSN
jgi:RimJ/RimL family protein N-acetyltransferase